MGNNSFKPRWIFYIAFVSAVVVLVIIFLPRPETWRVKSVIDGDSIVLEGDDTIRYIGIDAPEPSQPFYHQSMDFNAFMVNKKVISVKTEYPKGDSRNYDTYGRLLTYVYVGDLFVNEELIKKGLARLYPFRSHPAYIDSFCFLQKKARRQEIGIWSVTVHEREEYYIGNKRSLRFHRPNCKYALQMQDTNKIVFKTRDEALDSCYSPCRNCEP